MKFDTLVAVTLLIAAGVVSFSAYQQIEQIERPRQEFMNAIAPGNRRYGAYNGTQCMGTLNVALNHEPATTLIITGDFSFSYQGESVAVTPFIGAYFNVLDQLVACNLSVEAKDFRLDVKVSNPNPVLIDVRAALGQFSLTRRWSLPGPILLRRNKDGTYRLDYLLLQEFQSGYLPSSVALAAESDHFVGLNLRVQPFEQLPNECDFTSGKALRMELDPIVEKIQALLPLIQKFVSAQLIPVHFVVRGQKMLDEQ